MLALRSSHHMHAGYCVGRPVCGLRRSQTSDQRVPRMEVMQRRRVEHDCSSGWTDRCETPYVFHWCTNLAEGAAVGLTRSECVCRMREVTPMQSERQESTHSVKYRLGQCQATPHLVSSLSLVAWRSADPCSTALLVVRPPVYSSPQRQCIVSSLAC